MAKSFKYKNEKYLDSTGIVHNKKMLSDLLSEKLPEDVTDKFTFNGTATGKAYKVGNIVCLQFCLYPAQTHGWGILASVPKELYPAEISDSGAPILTTECWIYGKNKADGAGVIRGKSTVGTAILLCGIYVTE